jgi:hypothetical protein
MCLHGLIARVVMLAARFYQVSQAQGRRDCNAAKGNSSLPIFLLLALPNMSLLRVVPLVCLQDINATRDEP